LYLGLEGQIIQWFAGLANIALGFLIGSIITGWFTLKFVVPRAMKNKDIQDLKALLASLVEMKNFFENLNIPELKTLIEKGVARLEKIIENQENHD
jgi:hypothetical protein